MRTKKNASPLELMTKAIWIDDHSVIESAFSVKKLLAKLHKARLRRSFSPTCFEMIEMPVQNLEVGRRQPGLWTRIPSHWTLVTLSLMVVLSFLLRAFPLLQYPRVGGDPFTHYNYSIALLNGKMSVPVEAGSTGKMVELYYPPLFQLISLAFFLALPRVDPHAIMKS